jgi:hypothetical protein
VITINLLPPPISSIIPFIPFKNASSAVKSEAPPVSKVAKTILTNLFEN